MEKQLESKNIPMRNALCFNEDCPLREKVPALSDLPYGLTFEVHKRNRILFVFLNLCDFS